MCGLYVALGWGIPKCPWIRHTIHKSFVGLAKSSAAWWNLPPWVAFSKTENEERGPGRGQMGRAELELAPLRGRCSVWDHLCLELTAVSCVVELGRPGQGWPDTTAGKRRKRHTATNE